MTAPQPPGGSPAAPAPAPLRAVMRGFDRVALVLILAMLAASAAAYRALPPTLVTHWGSDGVPNGWTPRPLAVVVLPVAAALLWLVFRAAPVVDPRRANYERFAGTHRTIGVAALALVAGGHGLILGAALGWAVPVARFAAFAVGALLLVLGNVLPRVRPNYFVGIRTPWTLASDAVWTRTHRVGGRLFVAAGAVGIAAGVAGAPHADPIAAGAAATAALATVLYSYAAWRRDQDRPSATRP